MARTLRPNLQNSKEEVEHLVEFMSSPHDDKEDEINRKFGGVQGIASLLQTSTKKGIIAVTESLNERTRIFGYNRLGGKNVGRKPISHYFLYSLSDVVLLLVVLGAIVLVVLGNYYPETCQGKPIEHSEKLAWMEGVGILGTAFVIILLSAFSDFIRDLYRFDLQDQVEQERKATVIRGGVRQEICYRDIKVGDLCEVHAGSIIPADGILVEITEIITDESFINRGKRSIKSKKDPFVFTSTHVIVGHGKMIVLAVGEKTQAGILVRNRRNEARHEDIKRSSQTLQGKLTRASAILGLLGVIVGLIVALVLIISFVVKVYSLDDRDYDPRHWNDFLKAIIIGFVIIIVAEPEGLSMAVTISVSRSLGYMQRKNIFVRNDEILETMGNVTTMCCNKTGVLTTVSNLPMRETVKESYINGQHHRGDASDYKTKIHEKMIDELANGIAINTSYTSNIQFSDTDGTTMPAGDITECALLEFADDLDVSYRHIRRVNPEDTFFKVFPFDPDLKCMATVVQEDKEHYKIYSKGAPEVMLDKCSHLMTAEGEEPLDSDRRKRCQDIVEAMETKSQLKVICLASKKREERSTDDVAWSSEEVNSKLTLVAVIGIESTVGQKSTGNRMVVAEGKLISKNPFEARHIRAHFRAVDSVLVDDFTRGVAVNTDYLSNIQNEGPDRLPQQVGDPQECALLEFVLELGRAYQHYRDEYPYEKHVVYKSFANDPPNQQYNATVIRKPETYRVYVRGGIDYVLGRSTRLLQNHPDGAIKFDDGKKHNFRREVAEMEKRDVFPVAFAVKDIDIKADGSTPDWNNRDEILSNLVFVGYLGLKETARGEVTNAILECQKAGLQVSMVTGSSLQSAGAFAKKCGILQPTKNWPLKETSVFGMDIQAFDKETLGNSGKIDQVKFDKVWPDNLRVLANCPPAKKQLIVEGIKNSRVKPTGEVVAVVASGVHDGPFIREGDVGLSMGVSGSNVAQEAADIVLKTDNFSGVLETIKWGRHIYETVLKFLQFQLTATWVTLIVLFVGAIIFQKSLFSAAQLLWLNLIMDALASIALTGDTPSKSILRHKPYGRDKPLISRSIIRNIIGHCIYQIAVIFIIIFLFAEFTDTKNGYTEKNICRPSQHSTMVFTTLILMQIFNEINCRRVQDRNVFFNKDDKFDWVFLLVILFCFGMQILIVFEFNNAFRVRPMDAQQWLWCFFFGFSELLWGQIIFTIPKKVIPRKMRCCSKGVPPKQKGCCFFFRGVRSRDEVDAPAEFYAIGTHNPRQPRNSVGPTRA